MKLSAILMLSGLILACVPEKRYEVVSHTELENICAQTTIDLALVLVDAPVENGEMYVSEVDDPLTSVAMLPAGSQVKVTSVVIFRSFELSTAKLLGAADTHPDIVIDVSALFDPIWRHNLYRSHTRGSELAREPALVESLARQCP